MKKVVPPPLDDFDRWQEARRHRRPIDLGYYDSPEDEVLLVDVFHASWRNHWPL